MFFNVNVHLQKDINQCPHNFILEHIHMYGGVSFVTTLTRTSGQQPGTEANMAHMTKHRGIGMLLSDAIPGYSHEHHQLCSMLPGMSYEKLKM